MDEPDTSTDPTPLASASPKHRRRELASGWIQRQRDKHRWTDDQLDAALILVVVAATDLGFRWVPATELNELSGGTLTTQLDSLTSTGIIVRVDHLFPTVRYTVNIDTARLDR